MSVLLRRMTEEAGSDDVFDRIENGQDGDNVEEAEMGDDGSRGNRVDDPVSFFFKGGSPPFTFILPYFTSYAQSLREE